ncbi:hypothetical protein AGLY_016756 [Aphis glycines]|uniref:Uncharacterized protein n=1 Tax=Aphis glycines TaxID=307491 RepID=A0A6G0SWU7_APHGL|nr:hypothetical protein AGLY_016756 [Aphis glycines]
MFTFNGYKHQGHSIAVENHPQTSRTFDLQSKTTLKVGNRSILSTSYVVQRNKKKKFQKSINNSKNTYLFENSTIHRYRYIKHFILAVFDHYFFCLLNYLKTVGKCSPLTGYKHPRTSICSRKTHPQSLYRSILSDLVMLFAVFGHFFFVYLNYFENCWEMFTFYGYKHQGHSICSRKPPSKFVIGAFFRLVMLYKETKKKNFRNL